MNLEFFATRFSRILLTLLLLLFSSVAAAKTYRIGVLVPLTGPKADKGISLLHAAELFVAQFNASGGRDGAKLELAVSDDFNDPVKARTAAMNMVKDDSILAVIGHYYPEEALATAKIFADAKIPFLSPNVSNPELLDLNKWAFSLNVSDDDQGSFMAVYIKEILKKDNVLLIYNTDEFGLGLKKAFVQKAGRIGLKINKVLAVDHKALPKDWVSRNLPNQAENQEIGIVAALTHSSTGLALMPQLRDHGIKTQVMATSSWTNPKFLDFDHKYSDEIYLTSSFLWEISNQSATRFARVYEKKYREAPPVPAAMAYDAMLLLSKAIKALDSADSKSPPSRAGIRDFLAKLDWQDAVEGVTGLLYFNNKYDKTADYVAKYMANRKQSGQDGATEKSAARSMSRPAAGPNGAAAETVPDQAPAPDAGDVQHRTVQRDMLVSRIMDGRFKVAPAQLIHPREEYVLKDLAERIKKGQVMIVDSVPYHIVDVVFVGVDVIRVNDVSIKDMQWDVDVFMWFKWSGERLNVADIEDIGAINAVREQSVLFRENLSQPTKYRAYKRRLTLSAPFNLTMFPFDTQTLPMSLAHKNKDTTQVMMVLDSRHMDTAAVEEINPQEWAFTRRNAYSNLYRYTSTFGDPDYRSGKSYTSPIYFSTINLDIGIKRILQPYFSTFFLPLVILLGIILLILWVPVDHFVPRINGTISGLIGILVYHMSEKNSFPKVGYTMFADYYFLFAYAFVVAITFFIIKMQLMLSSGRIDVVSKWNRRFGICALVAAIAAYSGMTLFAIYFG